MLGIKEEKDMVEEAYKKNDFDGMEKHFISYLELLNFNLITNEPFYGTFFINLRRICDFRLPAPAATNIEKTVMQFIYNPILFKDYTDSETIAIIKHEIFHLMNYHILRAKEINLNEDSFEHSMLNISMDVAINQLIDGLPKDALTLKWFEKTYNTSAMSRQTFEYYYDLMKNSSKYAQEKKNYENTKKLIKDLIEDLNKLNDPNTSQEEKEKIKKDIEDILEQLGGILGDGNSNSMVVDGSHGQWKNSNPTDVENQKELIKEQLKNIINKCRGNVPMEVQSIFDKLNKPPVIKWEDDFKNMIGSVKCPYKNTLLRRPRRQMDRYDLKGRLSDRKVDVVVALDTSGSVSDYDLQCFFNEIFSILKTVKYRVRIIECDAEVHRCYEVKNEKQVETKVCGRGGTAFKPVFKYIKEELKCNLDLLIYFTDGFGENEIDEKYKPKGYKLMWILTDNKKNLSLKDPWTRIVKDLHNKGFNN